MNSLACDPRRQDRSLHSERHVGVVGIGDLERAQVSPLWPQASAPAGPLLDALPPDSTCFLIVLVSAQVSPCHLSGGAPHPSHPAPRFFRVARLITEGFGAVFSVSSLCSAGSLWAGTSLRSRSCPQSPEQGWHGWSSLLKE